MSKLPLPLLYLIGSMFILAEFGFMGYLGLKLAKRSPSDIRIVSVVLSLSILSTILVVLWAKSAGGLDVHGTFQGPIGEALNKILAFMLNLDSDVKVLCTICLVIIGPQISSYVLAGLFGCATAPVFVGRTLSFFVWSLVKSMVAAAGIVATLAVCGPLLAWAGTSVRGTFGMIILSVTLVFMSLFSLSMYREINEDLAKSFPANSGRQAVLLRSLRKARGWLTRNSP